MNIVPLHFVKGSELFIGERRQEYIYCVQIRYHCNFAELVRSDLRFSGFDTRVLGRRECSSVC